MQSDEILDDLHIRILRVTEDLRAIQQQLNCAVMQAPGDPELMEALCQAPEMDSLQVLKAALDQMRHFLFFYSQIMNNESEVAEQLREIRQQPSNEPAISPRIAAAEKFRLAADAALLQFLSDGKVRKPN
jgi:molybdopterin-biosynthesis enzyme MoeA-like protein